MALRPSLWNEPDTQAKESEKSINQGQKTLGMKEKSPAMPGVVFLKYLKVTGSGSDSQGEFELDPIRRRMRL